MLTAILVLLGLFFAGIIYIYTKSHLGSIPSSGKNPNTDFQAIAFHTYKPPQGIIPKRGKLMIDAAINWASHYKCPIILSVGYTVKNHPKTESEIYADRIKSIDKKIPVITARNPGVRDTDGEVRSCWQYCIDNQLARIAVLGAYPHLGSRILRYWFRVNRNPEISVTFVGVAIPVKYYFWELAMMVAEIVLIPGSKQRRIILDFFGRKK